MISSDYPYNHYGTCNGMYCRNGCWKYFCPSCGIGTNRLFKPQCECGSIFWDQPKKKCIDTTKNCGPITNES